MSTNTTETPESVLPNLELSRFSKQLLLKFQSQEITREEFLMECSYWALKDGFHELRPRPLPTKPDRMYEIESASKTEQAKIDFVKLFERFPELKNYRENYRMIKNENSAKEEWLKQILDYIPQGDFPSREKINTQLLRFRFMRDQEGRG